MKVKNRFQRIGIRDFMIGALVEKGLRPRNGMNDQDRRNPLGRIYRRERRIECPHKVYIQYPLGSMNLKIKAWYPVEVESGIPERGRQYTAQGNIFWLQP